MNATQEMNAVVADTVNRLGALMDRFYFEIPATLTRNEKLTVYSTVTKMLNALVDTSVMLQGLTSPAAKEGHA